MKTINVFIYSYKIKGLFENLISIINNESKINQINYHVFDQNATDRRLSFEKLPNVFYRHISWDDTHGIPYYRKHVIFETNSNYFLEISPNISLPKGWDDTLINVLPDRSVISGKSIKTISIDNGQLSFIDKFTNNHAESNFIDTNLIFLKQQDSILLNQLQQLKHYGQDLYASILFLSRGIKIFSMQSNFYTIETFNNDLLYYPYSKTHGYNKMIDSIKLIDTKFFESFHGINLSEIKKLPYQIDDVLYYNPTTSLDNPNMPRFHFGYSSVSIL